ncbi:hypothetical protein C5167_003368 [Papaver somniferum]|uniref:Uncharacterized protein n=1 Tax=Papaver somniferum TaxID=3469 RepID=A0A4Y7L0R5_PAPSO|nr:hypothetical protein C5167_003368 [Papaver somniferum]
MSNFLKMFVAAYASLSLKEQICLSSKLLIVMRGSSTSRLTQKSTTDISIMMCGLKTEVSFAIELSKRW